MNRDFRKSATIITSILFCLVAHCLADEPIGYAWPKKDLLVTSTAPSSFKKLKNRGVYPLLVKLDLGYSIVCEGVDGQRYAAFLPFRDRFGELLNIREMGDTIEVSSRLEPLQTGAGDALSMPRSSWSTEVDLENVDLKPGTVPIRTGTRYPVLTQSEGNLSIQFTSAALTQTVVVAESDTKFLTVSEYSDAVAAEAAREKEQKAKQEEQRKQEQIKAEEKRKQEEEQRKLAEAKVAEEWKQAQAREEENARKQQAAQRRFEDWLKL